MTKYVKMIAEIDEETGDLSYDVTNIPGRGCEAVRVSMDERMGKPTVVRHTPEYYEKSVADNHVRTAAG